ncbi:hypothetical protein [Roseicyclus persicicus]|uniref:Uncharacterized protein n=1 Tax=Roseicyclus persicicus TaxID=2650661 RepID=A0A7X6GWL0_9RHOB|nr:hypothetical protein [Roseibacterium persicicum]NKX43653.1 hypothetical protein [Roseibacterium persicicum]
MLRRTVLALALLAAPAPALAEWVHIPSAARAQATGEGGVMLAVECGSTGVPGLNVEEIWPTTEWVSVDIVIGTTEYRLEARCEAGVCPLNLMSFPMIADVMETLQSGREAVISYTQGAYIGRVPLAGSRDAIGRVLAECPV